MRLSVIPKQNNRLGFLKKKNYTMEYYILSNSTDEKIIGKKYPQCKGIPSDMGLTSKWFEQPNSMTKLTNDEFPDFEPELIFELEEKAILTDVVSPSNISAKGFLVNEKVKSILSDFTLMEHKYYPAILIFKGSKLPYYWLHFKENENTFLGGIDFPDSIFKITNLAFMKIDDVKILSYDDFWNKKMALPMKHIRAEKIVLESKLYEKKIDLFYISYITSCFFVSKNMKMEIEMNNITGFEIQNQNVLQ